MENNQSVSNIDTIYVLLDIENYEIQSKDILNRLEKEKEEAKKILIYDTTHIHYVKIGDMTFELLTSGTKGYSYILQNSAYKLYIAKYKAKLEAFAPIQVRISSEFLWSYGINATWGYIYNLIAENFGNISKEKVCRVDLCTHVSNIDFITDCEKSYKGDFRKSQVFKTNNSINAITFGSRQNKNIYCRIYNKTLEIREKKHKNWFIDIWKSNGLGCENVWNVEFEIKAKLLNRFNIATVKDVTEHIRDLWEFCTKKWLVKIDRTNVRVERCKINKKWEELQNVFNFLPSVGLIEREKQIDIDANSLIPNIAGFIISYSARKNVFNINNAMEEVKKSVEKYLDNNNTTFFQKTMEKSTKLRECEVIENE